MHPKAIEPNAIKAPSRRGGVKKRSEAENFRRLVREQFRLDDPDAGIDEGRDVAGIARLKAPVMGHHEIAGPVDADYACAGRDQELHVHRLWIKAPGQARNV